jgi:outer membrane protein assembly factor BamB
VRITITCPSCRKKSQIDDSLKGKRLRCPYQDCKQPFRLSEAGEAIPVDQAVVEQPKVIDWQATQAGSPSRAWDMPAVADWQAAPPPQRANDGFVGAEAGSQAVSWQENTESDTGYLEPDTSYESPESVYYGPVKKKRAGLIMMIMVAVGLVGLAAGGLAFFKIKGQAEEKARNEAQADYTNGRFSAAEKKFDTLLEKFPESKEAGLYRFMRALSAIRAAAEDTSPEMDKASEALRKFYNDYRGKELYNKNLQGVSDAAFGLVNTGLAIAEKNSDRELLEKLRDEKTGLMVLAKDIAESLPEQKGVPEKKNAIEEKFKTANYAVSRTEARKAFLKELEETVAKQLPSGVEAAQQGQADLVRRFPELAKDNEINNKVDALVKSEPSLIKYTPHNQILERPTTTAGVTSLLICPQVSSKGAPAAVPANDPVVLFLARGVVSAHSVSNGEVRWAMRVGIDTHTLPVRIPARPPQPELALVLSTDTSANTSTVLAVETRNGQARWAYPLGAVCLGGPIVAGRIVYFPTADGSVHEIDALDGRLLGIFELGQPLTVPGGYDPRDRRLFVPAARKRIYVLDVGEKKRCAGVFYTNHTVGGLRAAPIVTASTLVVAEASSLGSMVIKSFSLSEEGDKATETPDKYRIRGWSWFQPYFDGDSLGYLTDRGSLALFGMKRNTSDKALFTLGPSAGDLYGIPVGERGGIDAASLPPVGPAQVAHVDLNEWWLLVGGKLYRYRFDLYRQQLVPAPQPPLDLGMPLQPSQARGRNLVLGTQALDRCLATAIDRETGQVVWQRQLGLMTGQDPVVLGNHIVAIDKSGGLLHLEAGKLPSGSGSGAADRIAGPAAGDWLANGIPGLDPASPPRVVVSPDGQFAIALLHDPGNDKITLRRYEPGKGIVSERTYRFESAPQSNATIALSNQSIVIPCRDGNLREIHFTGNAEPAALSWRGRDAAAGAVGHAAFLSDTQLIASDGFRELQRWERNLEGDTRWRKKSDASFQFNGRITTPIVLVPAAQGEKLICLGDDTGTVYLVSPSRNETVRSWRFPGKVTRGPFVRGKLMGVILDGVKLVWLDPEKDAPLWERPFDALGLAGEPQLVGNLILVSENTGNYYWLDATGAEKGKLESKQGAIPASAATALGDKHAFAPLSDGTALLLTAPTGGTVGSK